MDQNWVYNVCVYKGDPHLLLTQRVEDDGKFWHVVTSPIKTSPVIAMAMLDADKIFDNAGAANAREVGLQRIEARAKILFDIDDTSDSTWDEARCSHVLIDHGKVDALPALTPAGSAKAEWANLFNILIKCPAPSEDAAYLSQSVFYRMRRETETLPLRSTVANNLKNPILSYLQNHYGPFPNLGTLFNVRPDTKYVLQRRKPLALTLAQ